MEADIIDVAPAAAHSRLARLLSSAARGGLQSVERRRAFDQLWGTMAVVTPEETLTVRFDFGHLTIHAGSVGRAAVTISGSEAELLTFFGFSNERQGSLLAALHGTWGAVGVALRTGRPRVYGGLRHPRFLFSAVRLLRGD